jgi:glyoxylase-like metal-dependent hydrolase (beta-lactamase superfamily II)
MKTTTGTLMLAVLAAVIVGRLKPDTTMWPPRRARAGPLERSRTSPAISTACGNGAWATVFYVTPDGIILGDPINVALATWLKEQFAQRFKVPVRYVVYSHSHFDHAEGGAVFADTATFVAHENMLRNMDGRYPQMPGDMLDRNGNGVIDPDEIDIPTKTRPGVCGWGPELFHHVGSQQGRQGHAR